MIRNSVDDRLHHAGDAAERQRASAESCDLAVRTLGKRTHEVDGIAGRLLAVVLEVELLERRPQRSGGTGSRRGSTERRSRELRQNDVTGSPARHIGQSVAG